jgi:hypothetical protein
MRWIAVIAGAIAGYYCIVYPSCTWFWPQSNLCGILWPAGSLVGAGLGYWIAARKRA